MMCYRPFQMWQKDAKTGKYVQNTIPCGKCYACLSKRRNDWSFRNQQELKHSYTAYFVTLTYDDEHLPYHHVKPGTYKIPKEFDMYSYTLVWEDLEISEPFDVPCVSLRDCQLFLKRLRKECEPCRDIRYFLCSEYGGQTLRPHYHMILYNFPGSADDLAVTLDKVWNKGFYVIGDANSATISYTCKYILGVFELPTFLPKTFMRSSRRPGIGASYLTQQMVQYHRNRLQHYALIENGQRVNLPRYLRGKIFDDDFLQDNIRQKIAYYVSRENEKAYEKFQDYMSSSHSDFDEFEYFSQLREYVTKLRNKITKSTVL